jgi:hypothetical protein
MTQPTWPTRPTRRQNVRGLLALAGVVGFFYWLAYALPATPPERGSLLAAIVDKATALIPSIRDFSQASEWPPLAAAVMAIALLSVIPTIAVIAVIGLWSLDRSNALLPFSTKWFQLAFIVVVMIIGPVALAVLGLPLESDEHPFSIFSFFQVVQKHALSSRGWLAAWGFENYLLATFSIYVAVGLVRNFRRLWSAPNKNS